MCDCHKNAHSLHHICICVIMLYKYVIKELQMDPIMVAHSIAIVKINSLLFLIPCIYIQPVSNVHYILVHVPLPLDL